MKDVLPIGTKIKTNYGGGRVYRVESISEPCTCASYLNTINMKDPPATEPHFHLVVYFEGGEYMRAYRGYLGWYKYDQGRFVSVANDRDEFFIVEIPAGTQLNLF